MFRFIKDVFRFLHSSTYAFVDGNPSQLAARIRSNANGTDATIDRFVVIENKKNFHADHESAIYCGTHILNHHGQFHIGTKSHLGAYCHVNVCHGTVRIGNDVAIGPHCSIIAYSNDYAAGKLVTDLRRQEDIEIGNNVFIGAGCTLLPGTTIKDNVVVGAGAIVRGQLESNAVYAGVPVRKLKDLT